VTKTVSTCHEPRHDINITNLITKAWFKYHELQGMIYISPTRSWPKTLLKCHEQRHYLTCTNSTLRHDLNITHSIVTKILSKWHEPRYHLNITNSNPRDDLNITNSIVDKIIPKCTNWGIIWISQTRLQGMIWKSQARPWPRHYLHVTRSHELDHQAWSKYHELNRGEGIIRISQTWFQGMIWILRTQSWLRQYLNVTNFDQGMISI